MSVEVMKQALEAWQTSVYGSKSHHNAMLIAMTNMAQAIEQAEKQEPVAWVNALFNELKHGDEQHQKWLYEKLNSWVMANPPAAPVQERNFCERCGKRLGGEGHIHTCTPPTEKPTGQAPCARHCEANAFKIEIRRLEGELARIKAAQPAAAPVQEPVAKDWRKEPWGFGERRLHAVEEVVQTQPQREWVGLTDEEITALKRSGERYISSQDFAHAIEAKLKEKNT